MKIKQNKVQHTTVLQIAAQSCPWPVYCASRFPTNFWPRAANMPPFQHTTKTQSKSTRQPSSRIAHRSNGSIDSTRPMTRLVAHLPETVSSRLCPSTVSEKLYPFRDRSASVRSHGEAHSPCVPWYRLRFQLPLPFVLASDLVADMRCTAESFQKAE